MRRLLGGLLLCAFYAHADIPPPSCYADEAPCTRAYSANFVTGTCLQWYEPVGDSYMAAGFCTAWVDVPADWAELKYLPKASKDLRWTADITRPLSAPEQAVWDSLLAHRPLSVFAVAPNGTALTRPVYLAVSGGLKSTAYRVAVGVPCACSALRLGDYCSVAGQQNAASAIPNTPLPLDTVSLCARR